MLFRSLDTRIVTYTTRAYDEYIKARPTSSNYGMLVGHGTLRGCIMGFEDRDPSAEELEAMRERLDREMSEGAFGLSLGLAYPPSCFSKTEELVSLAEIVARHDERGSACLQEVERFAFYDRVKEKSYAVIMSGEKAKYANIILKKGVI